MLGFADGAGSKIGTGGMESKLLAARAALNAGVKVFIGTGHGAKSLSTSWKDMVMVRMLSMMRWLF